MATDDNDQTHEFGRKDRRIGRIVGYVFVFLFALAIVAAVLQATLDTPKSGNEVPSPQDTAPAAPERDRPERD